MQGVIENLTAKATYDQSRKLASVQDENAILSLPRAAQEFAGGAVVGGILGGSQTAGRNLANQLVLPGGNLITQKTADEVRSADVDNPLPLVMKSPTGEMQSRQVGSPVYQRAIRADLPGGEEQSTASTGKTVNENGLTALTDRERVNLSSRKRNKIVSTFQDAVSFVQNALSDRQNTDRAYLGKVPETTAQKVLSDTGINITGYNAVIPSGAVRHMFNRHGDANTEAAFGQRAVTPEDVARIPNVISDPDRVTLSSKPDANGRTALLFEKDLGDIFVTVQAVSDGTHSIQADTLYIRKKNSQDTVSDNGANTPSPNRNVQNVPPQSSFNKIILPGGQEVNTQTAAPFSMELPRALPIKDTSEIYDIYGSGSENLPETAVGANKASPWGEFVASSKEFFPEGANAARDVDVPSCGYGRSSARSGLSISGRSKKHRRPTYSPPKPPAQPTISTMCKTFLFWEVLAKIKLIHFISPDWRYHESVTI